jgi:hypothetical protein
VAEHGSEVWVAVSNDFIHFEDATDPVTFIHFCIQEHERAAQTLEGPDRNEWLASIKDGCGADPAWHREVNGRYRVVLAQLTQDTATAVATKKDPR